MTFIRDHYGKTYAPNTRETFRRQVLHQFIQGGIADYNPDKPGLPTNSPKAHYAVSEIALITIQAYGTEQWQTTVHTFQEIHDHLVITPQSSRDKHAISVHLPDNTMLALSPGEHNQLQAQVIEQFVAHFAPNAVLLYLGDPADKDLFVATKQLANLGIVVTEHDKLPDIILHDVARNWLFLIEVVTSHGPMTPKRIIELSVMLRDCNVGRIFVTAFLTFAEFRKYAKAIAWETEVWVAEVPEHLIHFNGDRFLGPR
jgi:type II restriction enzyme